MPEKVTATEESWDEVAFKHSWRNESGGKFHTFWEKEKAVVLVKTCQEQQKYRTTDDNCYLKNAARLNIILYSEIAEEQTNGDGNLTKIEISIA